MLSTSLLTKNIPFGSPPHSSNTTNKLPVGFSHDRGTWYLKLLTVNQFVSYLYVSMTGAWNQVYLIWLTISGKPVHSYLSIFSHCMSQHSYRRHNYQMLYMQASSGQYFCHLSILDLCPCCPYLEPTVNFQLVHWRLSRIVTRTHISTVLTQARAEVLYIVTSGN